MDILTRLDNLEKYLDEVIKKMNKLNHYQAAEISGAMHNISGLSQKIDETIYPEWIPEGYPYFGGEKVTYLGKYYRCIQNHTSQEDWAPAFAVSLWVPIADPAEEWPEWKQPSGAHDAYQKGDKVSHNDKHWISDIDANAYEPGVYGWSEA